MFHHVEVWLFVVVVVVDDLEYSTCIVFSIYKVLGRIRLWDYLQTGCAPSELIQNNKINMFFVSDNAGVDF